LLLLYLAPALFPILWRIIKPFLAEKTAKKIEILGGKKSRSVETMHAVSE